MYNFWNIFTGLVASYFAVELQNYYKLSEHNEWYLLYLAPILTAAVVILLLLGFMSLVMYKIRPLKKYEGFWIETVNSSTHSDENLISIMKIFYKKNNYHIVGKTEYADGRGCLATWKSENVFLYDKENFELDYIYKSDFFNSSSTTRGYAKIQLKHKIGFFIDIDHGSFFKKQPFNLTQIKKTKEIEDFDTRILNSTNKRCFINFYNEYK